MTTQCTLVVRSPSDLVSVLPYLIGYHPTDSVALVGLSGRQVEFGLCYELPPPECDEDSVAATVARQQVASVVVLGYGPAERVTPAVLRMTEALRAIGVRVADVLRVTDGRWWSYVCEDPRCCPPEGAPCQPADSVIAAEATLGGQVALPSRRDLVAQVAAVKGAERESMVAATERARKRFNDLLAGDLGAERYPHRLRRAGRVAVREAEKRYRSGRPLTDDEVAWLGLLLIDKSVEDYALERVAPQEWRIRLWTDVLRRVEPTYVPGPACLLGFAAWRAGRGALARVAVDRALDVEPQHQLAGLLHNVLGFGLSPYIVRSWRRRR